MTKHNEFKKRYRRGAATAAKPPSARKSAAGLTAFSKTIVDKIEMVPTASLKPFGRRTRIHTERLIATMMGSFDTFGLINPIVVDENGAIIAGEARCEAARRLGITHMPAVRVAHLSEAEKRAYKIAENRIGELAGWDIPALALELGELAIEIELDPIGFSAAEIDIVIGEAAGGATAAPDPADDIPAVEPGPAVSRTGDIWLLGRHRLICGSALDEGVLQALMGDEQARMILTDAPFNVPISGFVGGLGKVKHREFAMASGEMSNAEFLQFLTTASTAAAAFLLDGGLVYGFMDWRGLGIYMDALEAAGLTQLNLCVWNKGTGGMGSLYRSQHELCLVYKKGTAPHINNVELGKHGRYRTNVWDHPGMASFGHGRDEALKMHPTVKPVNLLVEAIKDVTRQNDIVLDTFLGSGSTLIAADKCQRVCRGVEIDPLYVDTIVRRFEAFTGIEAVHASTGKRFAELAALRAEEAKAAADPAEPETSTAIQGDPTREAAGDPLADVRVRGRTRSKSAKTEEVANV
jgi:DNA modification methylase